MEVATLVLEYLRVVLSPQMIVGAIGVAFFYLFKSEIRSLLSRIATIKWGSAEVSAPQLPADISPKNDVTPPPANEENQQALSLPADANLTADERQRLEKTFIAERARAHLWEYRYLNYFFVHNTQRVLDWLASLPNAPTFLMYDAWWQSTIPSADQRRTIINVLESHNLIHFNGELIEITPKGREYIQWRGPTPPVLPTQESAI
ncbi:hypothetical protein [Noviherbaspirillum sp.]|uniref:hypothetical protein n=1 Tax=Noviherbaspirillum sp. TaxID=1926288 RepID=UPI002B496D0C|nr:hypothetical protein [Noviherbaspirillum sp.]HJV81759.1 hypothetical protein [Noviherbaspirillum sp.]